MPANSEVETPTIWITLQESLEIIWFGYRGFLAISIAFMFLPFMIFRLLSHNMAGIFSTQLFDLTSSTYYPIYELFSTQTATIFAYRGLILFLQITGWILIIRQAQKIHLDKEKASIPNSEEITQAIKITFLRGLPIFICQQVVLIELIVYAPIHILNCMLGMAYVFVAIQNRRAWPSIRAAVSLRYASHTKISKTQLIFLLLLLNLFMIGMQITTHHLTQLMHNIDISFNLTSSPIWNQLITAKTFLTYGSIVSSFVLSAADTAYQLLLTTMYFCLYQAVRPRIAI